LWSARFGYKSRYALVQIVCGTNCMRYALSLFCDFDAQLGTCKLYIFARNPTNSLGAIEPVSLLNFPKTRFLEAEVARVKQVQVLSHITIEILCLDFGLCTLSWDIHSKTDTWSAAKSRELRNQLRLVYWVWPWFVPREPCWLFRFDETRICSPPWGACSRRQLTGCSLCDAPAPWFCQTSHSPAPWPDPIASEQSLPCVVCCTTRSRAWAKPVEWTTRSCGSW